MFFAEKDARDLVIAAGKKLLDANLVSRTWGNISARISENEFIITPSGRDYESLRPEDLVKVRMDDLSYAGAVKPSSEKGIHADAYLLRRDAAFVIHTHQFYASALSAEGKDFPFAPCAGYGLPGTGKLRKAVSASLAENPGSKAFLMEKHGALLLGESPEEAFALAEELEERSEKEFRSRVGAAEAEKIVEAYGKAHTGVYAYLDDFAQMIGFHAPLEGGKVLFPESDDPEASELIARKNCAAALYCRSGKRLSRVDAFLQRFVYLKKYSKQKYHAEA